jgi:histone H2A
MASMEHKKTKRTKITPDNLNLKSYINKVSKQLNPDLHVSEKTDDYIEDLLTYLLKLLMKSVNNLLDKSGAKTVSSSDIQFAVRLVFSSELRKHSITAGTNAVTNFNTARETKEKESRSQRAKLTLPVSRIENIMRDLSTDERMGGVSSVYMTGVLEYIARELLELGSKITVSKKKKTISPRHIETAVKNDTELSKLFKEVILTC